MPTESIIDRMKRSPVVFDGAMGTTIYARGIFINRCFDELCLTDPELVRGIHRAYIAAGADVIETNTFGANRIKLARFGLSDRTVEINHAGARLAREEAGPDHYVAGSVGPCLRTGQVLTPGHRQAAEQAFEECITALADGGVDVILLETFTHVDELLLAAGVAARTTLPVAASFTITPEAATPEGRPLDEIVHRLDAASEVDVIGLNCGTGPSAIYTAAERAMALTRKPLIVMPNAGQPKEVDGRMLYLTTPEYFTEYAKRLVELGARGVGGCCGTTPAHIKNMAAAVHALSGVKKHIAVTVYTPEEIEVEPIAPEDKSRLGAKLVRGETVTSVELLPPRSCNLAPLLERVRQCRAAGVDAINIPDGPRASARISPMISALAVQKEGGIEPILHYCCRDRNLIGMQSDLLGGYTAGIANFLIITGDPPKIGEYPDVTGVFDVDAIGLTRVAHNLNHGRDIGGNPVKPPPGILIGVGANPSAVEPQRELDRFREKIAAGAEYAITQPVFDTESLLRFLDRIHSFPRVIPIVAGIWPLTSYKNAEFMKNEVPGVDVPDAILERMSTCGTHEEGIAAGTAIAREIREAIADSVAGFQVSAPFGKVELALEVLA